jgi:ankyrin repeat protein
MQIKNLKTGNLIRFGGEHFKRLVKLQETTGVRYFTKKDLAGCVSANKKTITNTQQKGKKLGTNAKRKQKGGVLIDENTVRPYRTDACLVCFEEWKDKTKNLIPFQIDECKHEICTTCATRWFFQQKKNACPQCRVQVDVAVVKKQIRKIENKIKAAEVFEAIRENNLNKIKAYVEQGGDIDEIYDGYDDEEEGMSGSEEWMSDSEEEMNGSGANPLTYACMKNKPEIVKYLVDIGAKLDVHNEEDGYTPLHYAIWNNYFEIVKYLVDNGANVNVIEGEGETPLDLACKINIFKLVKYLVEKEADVTKLSLYHSLTNYYKYNSNNSFQIFKYLVDNGGNVKAKYRDDDTLLQIACRYKNIEMIEYLVDKGADVNSKNSYGNTPLSDACVNGTLEIVKYLVEKGAKVNAKNKDNKTPLELAHQKGHTEIVDFLTNIIRLKYIDFKKNIARGGGKIRKTKRKR